MTRCAISSSRCVGVRDNIVAFGGEPGNVTLFGESAGSTSTALQLVSPEAKGLARRYIMESGAGIGGGLVNDKDKAHALGAELASVFCPGASDVVACLRALPVQMLIEWGADRGISGAGWGATVNTGDAVLPDRPLNLLTTGRNNKGEIVIGSNKNEWELFLALGSPPALATVADLHAQIDRQFPEPALREALKMQYSGSDATARADFVRLMTDAAFRCPARVLARAIAAQGTAAYLYSFEEGRAWHALELPYVFGMPNERLLTPTLTEPLRAHLQGYWTAFAKGGDPNGADRPAWPRFERAGDQHLVLQMNSQASSGLARADCDFWEPLLR